MEKVELLLGALKELPEYEELLAAARDGKSAAVTGVSQINRSHSYGPAPGGDLSG